MPRYFTVEFENITLATASGDIDIFSLDPAAEKPIELCEVHLFNLTEVQEAGEEWLRLRYIHGHTTVGSGGTAATARPVSPIDTAAGTTVRTNDTTIASAGTAVNLASEGWQVRASYDWGPRPQGMGFWTSGANLFVVRLMAAPIDDINASGWCGFYEYP